MKTIEIQYGEARKRARLRWANSEHGKEHSRNYMKEYRNRPYVKAKLHEYYVKNKIADLEETLNSRDYTRQHDYQFLIDENRTLEQERNELIIDNKKLAHQIDDQVNRLRKVGAL